MKLFRKSPRVQFSIRRQLLAWLLIPISILLVIIASVTYYLAVDLAYDAYDEALANTGVSIANRLNFQNGHYELSLSKSAQAILREDGPDLFYYQIRSKDGKLIAGDTDVPMPQAKRLSKEAHFWKSNINGNVVRVSSQLVSIPDRPNESVLIQVAETVRKRENMVNEIMLIVFLPEILLILLSALAVWLGVSRGLSPLNTVRKAVSRRSQWDLTPLKESDAPKEVRPLVRAINDLLFRLKQDLDAQKRFVANSAHQLRTPLAGLKTQTQLAARQTELKDIFHHLENIETSADRCTRLVNQLLALAKIEPGNINTADVIDLESLSKQVVERHVREALSKGIDLGIECPDSTTTILGNQTMLEELITNLIENAIAYGANVGSKITVRIYNKGHGIDLEVEDDGPGIPIAERAKVFERFYRVLGSRTSGSGLGLSIVREIAHAHSATVHLGNGQNNKGTKITVKFPTINKQALSGAAIAGSATEAELVGSTRN